MTNSCCLHDFKALLVKDNYILGTKGYNIYRYNIKNGDFAFEAKINDKYAAFSRFFLTRRLLRAEITGFYTLQNGSQICIAKKGLFLRKAGSNAFKKCFNIKRGSRPMNLCVTSDRRIYFGEYFANIEKQEVHIYSSEDFGETWNIVFSFPAGEINHIHGIFEDPYTKLLWIVTGDRENECIIANTSDGFKTLNIVFRGNQDFRACFLLFYEKFIVFATDSQYMQNEIKKIDRSSLKIETLQKIQGSGIYGGKTQNIAFISTTIEPSEVNSDQNSHLWISMNGLNWKEVASYPKDIWHKSLFQFGSIRFPNYEISEGNPPLVFTGRSLKHIDNSTIIFNIANMDELK